MLPYISLGRASHSSMAKLPTKVKGNQGVNHSPAERGNPSPVTPSPALAIGHGLCEGRLDSMALYSSGTTRCLRLTICSVTDSIQGVDLYDEKRMEMKMFYDLVIKLL